MGKKYQEYLDIEIPDNLIKVLGAKKKKKQKELLKGLSITSKQLIAFIIYAWNNNGYTLSQYKSEHHNKGLHPEDLPKLIDINDAKVVKVGETSLTNGQLKNVIEYRKVIVAKFLDNRDDWHCLFFTFNSIKGNESWKDGQSHLHYISSKFGIPRKKVVEQLKSPKYKLGSLPHIGLIDNDVLPKNEKTN